MQNVLFVCLGNICRSPTAHAVFAYYVKQQKLADKIKVDSAGTAGYHEGEPPDKRSIEAARLRGYDLSTLRARQVIAADFNKFDYILAMDEDNLLNLEQMQPESYKGHLGLFLNFSSSIETEVPDPYYGGAQGFSKVLDLVESASEGLIKQIREKL